MKKLIWTALATLTSALAAAATLRLMDRLWRRVVKEPPPEAPRWARMLVGRPVQKQVATRVHPGI